MHFLCLHGYGTSSQVFEMQTATLRHELGGNHTYDFAEGCVSVEGDPDIKPLFPAEDEYFGYHVAGSATSILEALVDLKSYIATEGPFDGVMAFSNGAALAATLLIGNQKTALPPFKCAIFFSGGIPFDEETLHQDKVANLQPIETNLIKIPTAHIWGSNDQLWAWTSEILSNMCDGNFRTIHIHAGGHEVPGSRSKEAVTGALQAINKMIEAVQS